MPSLLLSLFACCAAPGFLSSGDKPAAGPTGAVSPGDAATTVGASAASAPGAVRCGVEGKWCTFDVPAPDQGFAPVETLSLPKALWGVDAPNLLKSITVAWDARAARLYAIGMATDRLVVVDPAVGRPTGTIDLDLRVHSPAILRLDEARRRLWRVDKADGAIRVVDLDKGEVVAKAQGGRPARGSDAKYPYKDAAIDPATGWLWVANLEGSSLTGYSPDLRTTKVATGITGPASLDARADELLVVDAPSPRESRLLRYRPSTDSIVSESAIPAAAGPTGAAFAPDGTVILKGRRLAALGPDGSPTWSQALDGKAEDVVFTDDTVAVLVGDDAEGSAAGGGGGARGRGGAGAGGPGGRGGGGGGGGRKGLPPSERPPLDEAGDPRDAAVKDGATGTAERHLLLFDLATGRPKGDVPVRFEAKSASADRASGRIFVGNGGDGSVSVVDVAKGAAVGAYDVGAAAEHVLIDAKTGDRYVVDRLGGSKVYRWAKGATAVDGWDAGKWPSDAVIDAGRRRLWTLGHYDGVLQGWDLDTRTALPPVSLGLPENRSDTLGDLDYDAAVGLAAAVFPESGGLAVVDAAMGKVLWARTEDSLAAGPKAGPGNAFVAVDGKRDRLYVVADHGARVLAFGLRDGSARGELTLGGRALARNELYNINGAWLDRDAGTLYVGPRIVRVPALEEAGSLEGVGKVFWTEPKAILGLATGGGGEPERLVEVDPSTGAVRASWPLVPTGMMRLNPTYDPASRRVYVADMAEARVLAWDRR